MGEPGIGDAAPDFNLPRDGGGRISLSQLRGSPVVLFFYAKDGTPGCTAESVAFTALDTEFRSAGATVIGMSPDSVKSHDKFCMKHGISVILASDESTSTLQAYGVWKEKSMYGRRFMGVERTTFLLAPDGLIATIWQKVRVPGHAQVVLEAVRNL